MKLIKDDWIEMKSKIKTRWGKFTDQSLEALKENRDQLSGKLQELYGYTKEQAVKEYNTFIASIHEATEPVAPPRVKRSKGRPSRMSKKAA